MKYFSVAAFMVFLASPASAEDCMKYPAGPFRLQCMSAKNPGVSAKLERCRQQALNAGLRPGGGGGMRGYVEACMRGR